MFRNVSSVNDAGVALHAGTTTDTCTDKTQQSTGQAKLMLCEQLFGRIAFLLPTFWKYTAPEKTMIALSADIQTVFLNAILETGIMDKNAIQHVWLPGRAQKVHLQYLDLNHIYPGEYACPWMCDGYAYPNTKLVIRRMSGLLVFY